MCSCLCGEPATQRWTRPGQIRFCICCSCLSNLLWDVIDLLVILHQQTVVPHVCVEWAGQVGLKSTDSMPSWKMVAACPFADLRASKKCGKGCFQYIKTQAPTKAERDHLVTRMTGHIYSVHYEEVPRESDQTAYAEEAVNQAEVFDEDDYEEEDDAKVGSTTPAIINKVNLVTRNRAASRSPPPPMSRRFSASSASTSGASAQSISAASIKHLSTASLLEFVREARMELHRRNVGAPVDKQDL